ncbi:NAD(P)-dependent oxidoreductase [Stappia sp. MMSF_3263]|uniref:NAD(P)-dependent oxidoreductase n=1 Tax=Stappia sp. MMSF_3263 TaxID=3046693 RepID=UPI00273E2BE2|nr:NAD(P)-dependent oxidoreductase [Stappia sp. MMSF_3263]
MSRVAVLGLGAMGSRMAARLLKAGHSVTVWNRSAGPADALVESGAVSAPTPRAAAAGCELVITMVYDDAASEAVWLAPDTGALAGLEKGCVGIECSTVSLRHVLRLHDLAQERDLAFLDAPVAGSRPQAEAGELVFMAGGRVDVLETVGAVFLDLGRSAFHAGGPGAGALVKLMVNALLAAQTATLAELLGLAARSGADTATALEIIGATAVASPAIVSGGRAMLAGTFAPAAPVDLIAKDLALALRAGRDVGARLPMVAAGGAVFGTANAAGFGGDNLTGVVKLYRNPVPAG